MIFDKLFKTPLRIVLTVVVVVIIGYDIAVTLPFRKNVSHGSFSQLSMEDALVLKGQEVYAQEGCQYCHSQNLRPFKWEVTRFAQADKYGYYPLPTAMEYYREVPSLRGSFRIGPDLSRLAGKFDQTSLTAYLHGGSKEDSLKNRYHTMYFLFDDDELHPMYFSWKVRMMMEAGIPFSDPFQKSVFDRLEGSTRGDALVAYLLSLGQKKMQFEGAYYK